MLLLLYWYSHPFFLTHFFLSRSHNKGMARPSIRLYMIRHAESMNNEVYRKARHIYKGGTPDFDLDGWNTYVETNRTGALFVGVP